MANSGPPASGIMVVTHVYPQQGAQSATSPQSGVVPPVSSRLGKFLKGEPAALGTVQIMVGVVGFLFGIVTAFDVTISKFSGIMFWGAIIYITAGSLTVRANKKLNSCLVKASLGMNIFSTITAGTATLLFSMDLCFVMWISSTNACFAGDYYCQMNLSRTLGIAGVMLVLSVLEFIVSICVSAFACKATCCSNTEMPFFPTSVVPPVHNFSADGKHDYLPPEYTTTQE